MNKAISNDKYFLDEKKIIELLKKEDYKPNSILNNKNFNNITNFCSIGNYQFDKNEKVFLYRELGSILDLKKLTLDNFFILIEEKIYFYLKSKIYIEAKENKFCFYSKSNNTFILRAVDDSLFNGYIKLFLLLSENKKEINHGFRL